MPLPIISHTLVNGLASMPYGATLAKTAGGIATISLLKRYFGGAINQSIRVMHSKVVMITGGTSGIGAAIAYDLASRGAQIIILTQHSPTDIFLADYIDDLRKSTNNSLIYAEQVDLSSLHSIRRFATKWIDNTPPRRLDMVILCGSTMTPPSSEARGTLDGLNPEWQVNYLANFHLLSILSPALRAQPPDRDVRVIFATCPSYLGGELDFDILESATVVELPDADPHSKKEPSKKGTHKALRSSASMFATSKLALMVFARSFQAHLSNYDNLNRSKTQPARPNNSRVLVVDPGFSRTPGTRRWLTRGSLFGLFLYLLTWPLWWLILKSSQQGAQSFLLAAMEAGFSAVGETEEDKHRRVIGITGGKFIKECMQRDVLRKEVMDDKIAEKLWKFSQDQIEKTEKASALRRAVEKAKKESNKRKTEREQAKEKKGK